MENCNGDLGFGKGEHGGSECTMMRMNPARLLLEGFLEEVTLGQRYEG